MLFPSTLITGNNTSLIDQTVSDICQKLKTDLNPNNPDTLLINTDYSIDQIRSLRSFLAQKPFSHQNKLVVIQNADQLHHEAQNALLKILEEPGANNYLLLTSHRPQILLPTILSRCHCILTHSHKKTAAADLFSLSSDLKVNLTTVDQLLHQHDPKTIKDLISEQIATYHQILQHHPTPQNATIIEKLILATRMINSNVDPRSALDYFFLSN